MKKAIIGAGGFGKDVRLQMLNNNPLEDITFFVDDNYASNGLSPISQLDIAKYEVIVAINNPAERKRIVGKLPNNTKYFTFIHNSVLLFDTNIVIGQGTIICAGCILTTNIQIGEHSHLNLGAYIGHDTKVGKFFTASPGAKVSGNCNIGECVYLGTNSSIREKLVVCDDVTIGLNSGVVKNILKSGTYGGTPAKDIRG